MLSFSFADEEGEFDMDNIAVSDMSVRIIVITQSCPELEQLYLEGVILLIRAIGPLLILMQSNT